LGGGNHFLDALVPAGRSGPLHFLIHTGSRAESGLVDDLIDEPDAFDRDFSRIMAWAEENRATIQAELEGRFSSMELLLDAPHNSYEVLDDAAVVIRKGAVKVLPGDSAVIPSHMSGDVVLVRATNEVKESLFSLSHGTGRTMSRGESKRAANEFDFAELRRSIMLPEGLSDSSLRTEGPFAYRDLDECLLLLEDFIEVEERYRVLAYMGHL
jgi:RNA-splicing ligase RtcB